MHLDNSVTGFCEPLVPAKLKRCGRPSWIFTMLKRSEVKSLIIWYRPWSRHALLNSLGASHIAKEIDHWCKGGKMDRAVYNWMWLWYHYSMLKSQLQLQHSSDKNRTHIRHLTHQNHPYMDEGLGLLISITLLWVFSINLSCVIIGHDCIICATKLCLLIAGLTNWFKSVCKLSA